MNCANWNENFKFNEQMRAKIAVFSEKKCLNIKSKDGASGSEASCGYAVCTFDE